jgi:hypothetical protein
MARAVTEGVKNIQGVEVELNYYVPPETLSSFEVWFSAFPLITTICRSALRISCRMLPLKMLI